MWRNTEHSYGWIAILLHWSIAFLFLAQLGLGLTMVHIADQRRAFDLIQLHKSLGFLILALAALRLCWWIIEKHPGLPASTPRFEGLAAHVSHALLYAMQFVLPLTGWTLVSVSMLGIPSMPFNLFVMPNLPLAPGEAREAAFGEVHEWLAWAALGLIALHGAAALFHHFHRRDGVLTRMLRPRD